jgi:hypothetical protein
MGKTGGRPRTSGLFDRATSYSLDFSNIVHPILLHLYLDHLLLSPQPNFSFFASFSTFKFSLSNRNIPLFYFFLS